MMMVSHAMWSLGEREKAKKAILTSILQPNFGPMKKPVLLTGTEKFTATKK